MRVQATVDSRLNAICSRPVWILRVVAVAALTLLVFAGIAYAVHPPAPKPTDFEGVALSLTASFATVTGLTAIAHWTITRIRESAAQGLSAEAAEVLRKSKWRFWNIIRAEDWYPSLSLYQFLIWTLVILFVYFSIILVRASAGAEPVQITDPNLLILMGISVASPISAGALANIKYNLGSISTANPPKPLPGYSTMLQEGGKPSLTRFQMFAWTWIGVIVFLVHFFTGIYQNMSDVRHLEIPTVDNVLVVLTGLSQAAYLGGKAVTPSTKRHSIYPSSGKAGAPISIFAEDLDFGPTTDRVWFGDIPVGPDGITAWKTNRIDLTVPDGLEEGKVYEIKVAHGGKLTYVGNFTAK